MQTTANMDGDSIRQLLLKIVSERSGQGVGSLQSGSVLREVRKRLGDDLPAEMERAILTVWHDLFRNGHLAWGADLANAEPPFCHVTEQGRETLRHLNRDPANPAGYLEHLKQKAKLDAVARSYLEEGIKTYNANCFKATAVMVGVAAEALVLRVRDELVAHMQAKSVKIPKGLNDWRAKTVLDAITQHVDCIKKAEMPRELQESYDLFWSAFVGQIRQGRKVTRRASHRLAANRCIHRCLFFQSWHN